MTWLWAPHITGRWQPHLQLLHQPIQHSFSGSTAWVCVWGGGAHDKGPASAGHRASKGRDKNTSGYPSTFLDSCLVQMSCSLHPSSLSNCPVCELYSLAPNWIHFSSGIAKWWYSSCSISLAQIILAGIPKLPSKQEKQNEYLFLSLQFSSLTVFTVISSGSSIFQRG